MIARVLLMALLSTEPPAREALAPCEEWVSLHRINDETLLRHPYWGGWFAGASYRQDRMGGPFGMERSFDAVHELPGKAPRFRAPLSLPPPLTGELSMTLSPSVRKRKGFACIPVSFDTDPDWTKLLGLMMEDPPLRLRARVKNAGVSVLDVTWEARELRYNEDEPQGRRILEVPEPPPPGSSYRAGIRILLGPARDAIALLERPDDDSLDADVEFVDSLLRLGFSWEKLLQVPPPEQVSPAWRLLVLRLIGGDLNNPLDPRDPKRAERARRLEGLARVKVAADAEPLWGPLRRAWVARLRPPSRPGPSIGQAELRIVPGGKEGTGGSVEEVWLDGRRILCPGCSEPAFRGVNTRTVEVPPERAVRLWMRWKDMDGVHESEDWVPLLPGHRYQLRHTRYFHSASEQGTTIAIEPELGARGEKPACVTVEAEARAAPGLGWADLSMAQEPEAPPPRVRPVTFGTLQPVSREQWLGILPARGGSALTDRLWRLQPVRYLHAGTYRFLLERDGDVRLRFSPEVADCKPASR